MTSRQRLLTALHRGIPDRLPVTTHHVLPYYLDKYMNGRPCRDFFDDFGFDAILWAVAYKADASKGHYCDPTQSELGFLEGRRILSDTWRIVEEAIPGTQNKTTRFRFITPQKELSMVVQFTPQTAWVLEPLIKDKRDIDIIAEYATAPLCDVEQVNKAAAQWGERGIVRGHICCFEIFGQPGCWQDAACLYGIQNLIMATYQDPKWVHELLRVVQARKKTYIESMKGAKFDVLELGGGDASSSVISPILFEEYVAPYDRELIWLAHKVGQHVAYHTCGGMMPILEQIAAMDPDAMETFTPNEMGGDADLAAAKRRVGFKTCMIGGFNQFHFFMNSTPEETRAAVRQCFKEAGQGGGYILSPSDHFFDAKPELLAAFVDEAGKCVY